jgi:hypothetical protein
VSPPVAAAPSGPDGPGDPGVALSALADAALAQARREAAGAPDARVGVAFALGWQMAEIYRPEPPPAPAAGESGHLPALSDLSVDEWARVGLDQVQAGITKLRGAIVDAGLTVPDAERFAGRVTGLVGEERDRAIEGFHTRLLATLTAADFRLGKGYGIGRALADMTRHPADWRTELSPAPVATLASWLRDLSTALPPHAAHVVASSLEEWGEFAQAQPPTADGSAQSLDVALLQAQGRLWRSLISGEKRPTEMLEISDYVAAGESLLQSTARLAKAVLRHHAPVLLTALGLFIVGIALMLITDDAAGIVSGAGVILTALGIGWKGAGTAAGKALGRVGTPLWESALDLVIRDRITPARIVARVPATPVGPDEPSLTAVTRAHRRAPA